MIKINEEFSFHKIARCWELIQYHDATRKSDDDKGRWKKGDTYRKGDKTWHGNPRQCCDAILGEELGKEAGKASGDATSIIFAINEARDMIVHALEGVEL